MMDTYIVAGLGNPGREYENTRHNAGFRVIDILARRLGAQAFKTRHQAVIAECVTGGKKILLYKPQTYMNESGRCVREAVNFYKLPANRLIIVFDDIDINLGQIRIRNEGSAGTHNGMRSIIYLLSGDTFPRVRVGIGRPPENMELSDFVLSHHFPEEIDTIKSSYEKAADAVVDIISFGVQTAQGKFN